MEISMIAERKQVQFEGFAFHQEFIRHVGNGNGGKVRLTGNGTQAGKLGTIELDKIIIAGVLIGEFLQHLWIVIHAVMGTLTAQLCQAFLFTLFHANMTPLQ